MNWLLKYRRLVDLKYKCNLIKICHQSYGLFCFVFTGQQFSRNFQTGVDNSSIIEVSELDKQHCVLQINSVNVGSMTKHDILIKALKFPFIFIVIVSLFLIIPILHTFFETADACFNNYFKVFVTILYKTFRSLQKSDAEQHN